MVKHSGRSLPAASSEDWRHGGFGVYVHWPFCAAKCPYCDFNSHVRAEIDHAVWRDALLHELRAFAEMVPDRRVTSVFFGGGTPSLMRPETVGAVIDEVAGLWELPGDAEITLEANPTSVEASKFAGFRVAGVNRLSMGIQALNDADLKRLGRMHSAREAMDAFDVARAHFERVSFDLIYARQDQTVDEWRRELKRAIAMAVDHFSLYQLTIEPGTRFGELADRGRLRGLPADDISGDMYLMTQEVCAAAGLNGYEISNHARAGAECRHNLVYWRYGDYVGVGPGAHGRLSVDARRYATANIRSPEGWLDAVARSARGLAGEDEVPPEDQAAEYVLMGMRLAEGIDPGRYRQLSGEPLNPAAIAGLAESGHVETVQDRLRVTAKGRPLLNTIIKTLLFQ